MSSAEQGTLFDFGDPPEGEIAPDVPSDPAELSEVLAALPHEPHYTEDPDADTDPDSEPGTDTEPVTDTEPDPEPDTDTEPGTDADTVTEPDAEGDAPEQVATAAEAGLPASEFVDEPALSLWDGVVDQPRAIAQLRASARNPVHAYLFVGPPGVGAFESAIGFGAALLCRRGGCGTCDVCTRTKSRLHPDLTVVERDGPFITVEQAREIIRLATRAPIEGARKVLVLVDFHLVTTAGPTLLKIIEEPPQSTVFIVLAEHVPPELVTIASRCVQVPFGPIPRQTVIDTLIAEGADSEQAARAAQSSAGRLDRARLLVTDLSVGQRHTFWAMVPQRLDGTGATVASLAAEAVALLDSAAVGPLEARQRQELAVLEAQLEITGGRGQIGQRKELTERHKRELKRLRDDELRFGLSVLQGAYRDALIANSPVARHATGAVSAITKANEALERNPNVTLLLQSLLLRLPSLR